MTMSMKTKHKPSHIVLPMKSNGVDPSVNIESLKCFVFRTKTSACRRLYSKCAIRHLIHAQHIYRVCRTPVCPAQIQNETQMILLFSYLDVDVDVVATGRSLCSCSIPHFIHSLLGDARDRIHCLRRRCREPPFHCPHMYTRICAHMILYDRELCVCCVCLCVEVLKNQRVKPYITRTISFERMNDQTNNMHFAPINMPHAHAMFAPQRILKQNRRENKNSNSKIQKEKRSTKKKPTKRFDKQCLCSCRMCVLFSSSCPERDSVCNSIFFRFFLLVLLFLVAKVHSYVIH